MGKLDDLCAADDDCEVGLSCQLEENGELIQNWKCLAASSFSEYSDESSEEVDFEYDRIVDAEVVDVEAILLRGTENENGDLVINPIIPDSIGPLSDSNPYEYDMTLKTDNSPSNVLSPASNGIPVLPPTTNVETPSDVVVTPVVTGNANMLNPDVLVPIEKTLEEKKILLADIKYVNKAVVEYKELIDPLELVTSNAPSQTIQPNQVLEQGRKRSGAVVEFDLVDDNVDKEKVPLIEVKPMTDADIESSLADMYSIFLFLHYHYFS